MKAYTFYEDPEHGWLRVSKAKLKELGILSKITSFSFESGQYIYLEEDMDLTTFVKAMGIYDYDKWWNQNILIRRANKRSHVRNYPSFKGGLTWDNMLQRLVTVH